MSEMDHAAEELQSDIIDCKAALVELEQSFEPIELTASADRFSRVVDVVQTIALVVIALALRRR